MAEQTASNSVWQPLRKRAARFVRLLVAMAIVIAVLGMTEIAVLRFMGVKFRPAAAVLRNVTVDFAISADGRWVILWSRITYISAEHRPEDTVFLHDMHHLNRPARIDIGHSDLCGATISPAGDQLAFSTRDGTVSLWSRRGPPHAQQLIHQHQDALVRGLIWSPDGEYLAAYDASVIYLWETSSGRLLQALPHDHGVYVSLSFSRDSQHLLSAGDHGRLCLWRVPEGLLMNSLNLSNPVAASVLVADGGLAAFIVGDALSVWSFEQGRELWRKPRTQRWKRSLALSTDDAYLATADRDRADAQYGSRVVIRCVSSGRSLWEIDEPAMRANALAFAPDGTLCILDDSGCIIGWNLPLGSEAWRISLPDAASRLEGSL